MLDQFQAESKTSHKLRIVENVGRKKEADVGKIQDDMAPLQWEGEICKQKVSRWPSIRVAANWSGGRRNSFLHQGAGYKLPRSTVSSTLPVVTLTTPPPRSSPGTQWPSLGKRLENLLWRDTGTQPSPFQLHLLDVDFNSKH